MVKLIPYPTRSKPAQTRFQYCQEIIVAINSKSGIGNEKATWLIGCNESGLDSEAIKHFFKDKYGVETEGYLVEMVTYSMRKVWEFSFEINHKLLRELQMTTALFSITDPYVEHQRIYNPDQCYFPS